MQRILFIGFLGKLAGLKIAKMRFALVATFFILTVRADDEIMIPLDFGSGSRIKALAVRTSVQGSQPTNGCPSTPWCITYGIREVDGIDFEARVDVKLQFDVGGLCNKKPSQWSIQTEDRFSAVTTGDFPVEDTKGCTVDLVRATLISATYGARVLAHNEAPEVDFTDALKAIQAKRDVEEARRKTLAAERKQKEAVEAARLAKIRAAEDIKAAEDRAKTRAACTAIYQSTIDKKVKDLTVREDQQIRACEALGLYPPR
jgi:hypothetical protein